MTVNRIYIRKKHRKLLESLILAHLPEIEVWAYGSRVNGRSHEGSDLDLVLRGKGLNEIPIEQISDFEEAVQESNLPFLVEVRDWARLPERFHKEIALNHALFCKKDPLMESENAVNSDKAGIKKQRSEPETTEVKLATCQSR